MTEDTPISPIEHSLTTREGRPTALDGYSLKIVGWSPATGEA